MGLKTQRGSPRFVSINEECGNLKVVNDGGELTRDSNQKKKSGVDVHFVTMQAKVS